MASYFKIGTTWAVVYRLKGLKRQYVYGLKSEKLARQTKLLKDNEEQLARAGLFTPDPEADRLAAAARKPLAQHVEQFQRSILARGKTEQHAQQQAAHVHRLLRMARITSLEAIDAERVQEALARLRRERGARTCNAARGALMQFERWLHATKRIRQCVLGALHRFNEEEDVRRARRALTQVEVDWLLATTASATDRTSRRCGITPKDRAMLYAVGLATGLRRKALLSLTKASFLVAADEPRPMVRLAAVNNKKRRDFNQMLPPALAAQLRDWLAGKDDKGPLWNPSPHADLSLRFRRDMERARAAWITAGGAAAERDRRAASRTLQYVYHDGIRKRHADFHSLRHTGITFVVRAAGLKVAQVWADHSSPVLTARYAHIEASDLEAVLPALPNTDSVDRGAAERRRPANTDQKGASAPHSAPADLFGKSLEEIGQSPTPKPEAPHEA